MMTARGIWYDGKSSARREVTLSCEGSCIRVCGSGIEFVAPLRDVRIDPRLGSAKRMVRFPSGELVEASHHQFLDSLQRRQGKGAFFRVVHRWENSLGLALVALLLMLLASFCFVRYGLPFLACRAAFALPSATEEMLGRETLQILDRMVLKPSKLTGERRTELARVFAAMTAEHPERKGWRLEFRSGERIGANAFALPSGIVIVTDRLVEIARSDDEITGVLAHEMGHINRRHALRHIMQNSATALIVATITGDITSVTSLSATLPTALIDAKFSRDFEWEADAAAVAYLKEKGIPVKSYADMLRRIGSDHAKEGHDSQFGELLSDHPVMEERVNRVLGLSTERSMLK